MCRIWIPPPGCFTRNTVPFFGSPAGTLCIAASIRRTGGCIKCSFLCGRRVHAPPAAAPHRASGYDPKLSDGKAETVFFVQPFPNKFDHNQISTNF